MTKVILAILFLGTSTLSSVSLAAQDLEKDTVQFQSTVFTDVAGQVDVEANTVFIWFNAQRIDWIQGSENFTYSLTIQPSQSFAFPGGVGQSTVCRVSMPSGVNGIFVLKHQSSGYVIELSLDGGTTPISNKYAVSSLTTL
jgi:hypothetical protein